MTDIFNKSIRSKIMSKIRNKDSKIELLLRKEIWKRGYRYRKHYGKYQIDMAFAGVKVAVFIDSCFWHYCPIHGGIPSSNHLFWSNKLKKNRIRDSFVTKELKKEGWIVIRVWEHDLNRSTDKTVNKVVKSVNRRC